MLENIAIPRTPIPTLASNRNVLLHPLTIATALWGILLVFYALHLSTLLRFTTVQLLPVILVIWMPFALVATFLALWRPKKLRSRYRVVLPDRRRLHLIERRLTFLWRVWLCAAVVETLASGGLPIFWIFTNPAKTYFDYGIPSVHGFVNSLLLALSLSRFLLYLLTGDRRQLVVPVLCVTWWILLITRGSVFFIGIECTILFFRVRPVRTKMLAGLVAIVICVVLLFGWLGDIRTGAGSFRDLAQPTDSYPSWLPSGILWVYIYATTPLNNLQYSLETKSPEQSLLFPHTLSVLLPTVIKNYVYGDASAAAEALTGELIESNFNVSTAYLGPAQDFGLGAIFLFSLITATICQWYWYKSDLRSQLVFAVLAHCLILSLFNNLFLYLPIIAQIGWFYLIFRTSRVPAVKRARHSLALTSSAIGSP